MRSVLHKLQRKSGKVSLSAISKFTWIMPTYFVLILFAIIIAFPLFFMVSLSLQSFQEVSHFPPIIIPSSFQFGNYVTLFERIPLFPRYLLNSFIFAGSIVVGHLFLSSLTGYIFAKFNFPFKRAIITFVLISLLFPGNLRVIPLYSFMVKLGLVNTYAGLIIPFIVGPFTIFIMYRFISSIPTEIMEVARIDGASEPRIFLSIILPLAKPALVVVTIFQFTFRWNMYLWPLVMTRGKLRTLPVVVAQFKGTESFFRWNLIGTACILLLIPSFLIFIFLQRYITRGTAGALKF